MIEVTKDPVTLQTGCFLTLKGKRLFNLNFVDRQIEFIKLIISHSVFKKILKLSLENGELISKEAIVEVMKDANLFNVKSDSTYFRRASTVIG